MGNNQSLITIPESTQNIVDAVCSNKFNFDLEGPIIQGRYTEETVNVDKDLEDPTRPLKNIATDFVVNQLFQTEGTLFLFMQVVYQTFEHALEIYRKKRNLKANDLFFLYKGGNVLRLVAKEFLLEIPSSATRAIEEFYAPFFKRSDADFTIYLRPSVADYDQTFKELSLISYLLQSQIRQNFADHKEKFFDYSRWKTELQDRTLKGYLDKFNEIDGFHFTNVTLGEANAQSDRSAPCRAKADQVRQFLNKEPSTQESKSGTRIVANTDIENGDTVMNVAYNTTLVFRAGAKRERLVRFDLVRTKVNLLLTDAMGKQQFVGGELIDVSMGHADATDFGHFFDHLDQYVREYTMNQDGAVLRFKSYSTEYLMLDLEMILFLSGMPWEDAKYAKRINRLVYLYFVDLFMKVSDGDQRLRLLTDLRDDVLLPLLKTPQNARGGVLKFKANHPRKDLALDNLFTHLTVLAGRIQSAGDKAEFKAMIELFLENVDFLLKTLRSIRTYCERDGIVTSQAIYSGDTQDWL